MPMKRSRKRDFTSGGSDCTASTSVVDRLKHRPCPRGDDDLVAGRSPGEGAERHTLVESNPLGNQLILLPDSCGYRDANLAPCGSVTANKAVAFATALASALRAALRARVAAAEADKSIVVESHSSREVATMPAGKLLPQLLHQEEQCERCGRDEDEINACVP